MERYNATKTCTIHVNDDQWDNADLITLLYKITDPKEIVLTEQPDFKVEGVFFIEPSKVPKDLFKHKGEFTWLFGSVKLWYNDEPVTKENYRTVISGEDNDGSDTTYIYLDWEKVTDIAPVQTEEGFLIIK